MQKEAELFLASHLHELNSIDDKHEMVTVALATISAVCPEISETYISLYLSQLTLDDSTKTAALSYFSGSGILNIFCDCAQSPCAFTEDINFFWFNKGQQDRESCAPQYTQTIEWIESLRYKLS